MPVQTTWRVLFGFLAVVLGLCLPSSSFGWGGVGHRFMTDAAIPELPNPLRAFFLTYAKVFTNAAGVEPPGRHYIDIDYYPEFLAGTFPHDVNVLLASYSPTTVTNNGMAPWTAQEHYENLRKQFAAAITLSDWTNLIATAAGPLAHYLEDLHNPMHLVVNYDGQLTGQSGLHSRYESALISARITAGLRLTNNPAGCVYYPSLLEAVFSDIDLVYPNNSPLLAADLSAYAAAGDRTSTLYYQHLWEDGCSSFTPQVMQRAVDMVASAMYSAWRDAGFPAPPGVAPSTVVTLKASGADPTAFRFSIHGDAGQTVAIQTSTNLVNWTQHSVVTNLDGRMEFTATRAPNGHRYYRVAPPE